MKELLEKLESGALSAIDGAKTMDDLEKFACNTSVRKVN